MNTHGIGLGLFICKSIVQAFKGKIYVQSEPDRGTRFLFSFFLDDLSQPEAKETSSIVRVNSTFNRSLVADNFGMNQSSGNSSIEEIFSGK